MLSRKHFLPQVLRVSRIQNCKAFGQFGATAVVWEERNKRGEELAFLL